MMVNVTKHHLKVGLVRSYTHDAVCLAVREAIKDQYDIEHFNVLIPNLDFMFIDGAIVELPEQARVLIMMIDRKQNPKPISFEIEDFPTGFFEQTPFRR